VGSLRVASPSHKLSFPPRMRWQNSTASLVLPIPSELVHTQDEDTMFIIFTLSHAGRSGRAVDGKDYQWGWVLRSCDVAPSLLIYVVIFKVIPCLLQNKYTLKIKLTISRKSSKKYSCHFEFEVQWRVVRGFSLIVDLVNSTGKRIII